ncbi:MAG TPA: hypothetical protein VEG60_32265, partial [Candidatus Binatia bacterium]|nr:hypothetical protein [Candidatus Binatia bacterium]
YVLVDCAHCGGEHFVLLRIYLVHGPERKQSIADLFRDRAVPPQVAALKRHTALCLKTGQKFKLEEDERVFLVPTSSFSV